MSMHKTTDGRQCGCTSDPLPLHQALELERAADGLSAPHEPSEDAVSHAEGAVESLEGYAIQLARALESAEGDDVGAADEAISDNDLALVGARARLTEAEAARESVRASRVDEREVFLARAKALRAEHVELVAAQKAEAIAARKAGETKRGR